MTGQTHTVLAKRRKGRLHRGERWMSVVFLAPAVLILLATSVYPLGYSFVLSFYAYDMSLPNAQPVPTGFDNYTELLSDSSFLNSVQVSFTFVAVAVAIEFCLGIALGLLVTARLRWVGILRTALLIPIMMTPVVVGVLWRTLFNSSYGVVNYLLSLVHIPPQEWLGSPNQALPTVIVVEIWQGLPIVTFIVAAGIQALPLDIFEQARIDGASPWQIFRYVTLPLLRPVLLVVLLLRIMDAFKTFDIIYTLTQGGPGETTNVLSMLIYKVGLQFFQIGQAAAMSWVFLAFIFSISVVFVWQLQRLEAS